MFIELGTDNGVRIDGKILKAPPMERKLFQLFALNAGRPVTYEQMIDFTYGDDREIPLDFKRNLLVIISNLKKSLGKPLSFLIVNQSGYGYMLKPEGLIIKLKWEKFLWTSSKREPFKLRDMPLEATASQ